MLSNKNSLKEGKDDDFFFTTVVSPDTARLPRSGRQTTSPPDTQPDVKPAQTLVSDSEE